MSSSYPVVWRLSLSVVFQVQRVDIESVDNIVGVSQPHGGAVEID